MNSKPLLITAIVLLIAVVWAVVNQNYGLYVDLPEEYKAISKDSLSPDVLNGYIRNDTLFISFRH